MKTVMIELRDMRCFVAVAEELNFRRAADRLGMTRSPLSQRILQLERDLGVDLFERSRHYVRLTAEGEIFLRDVVRILAAVERATARLNDEPDAIDLREDDWPDQAPSESKAATRGASTGRRDGGP